MRCLTSCLRLDIAVKRLEGCIDHILDLARFIQIVKDEEIVANGCKCIRICLREDKVSD